MLKLQLTANAVKDLMEGKQLTAVILQILSTKKVGSVTGAERYQALISDGTYSYGYAMLATQLNGLVTSRQLEDYSIVRVNNPIVKTINKQGKEEKRTVVLRDLEILKRGLEVGRRVGDPVKWTPGASKAASKPQAPAPPLDALSALKILGFIDPQCLYESD
ncbi:replication protein A 70 kDa DNA-binding subunit-like [Artemia franciscana]|uniref:replication protein A 70 kDa DNA-binding subunit-like n=1 Tax=Artemia franciscana TaxID=6661 RepID=UPI0032DB6A96